MAIADLDIGSMASTTAVWEITLATACYSHVLSLLLLSPALPRIGGKPRSGEITMGRGTDLPFDEPGPPADGVPVVWLNPTLELSLGKAAAQVGHASMLLAASLSSDSLAR